MIRDKIYTVNGIEFTEHVQAMVFDRTISKLLTFNHLKRFGDRHIPGGKCRYNETPEHAMYRELKEETNIGLHDRVHLFPFGDEPYSINTIIEDGRIHKIHVFIIIINDGEYSNVECEKHSDMRWTTIDEIRQFKCGYILESFDLIGVRDLIQKMLKS